MEEADHEGVALWRIFEGDGKSARASISSPEEDKSDAGAIAIHDNDLYATHYMVNEQSRRVF